MGHVLHCGDGIAGMAALPDRSVDHVITDPPYEAEAHTLQRRVKSSNGKHVVEAPLSFAAITEETRRIAAAHFARISRRWIVVFCQAEAVAAWRDALVAGGATYKRACVWIKRDGQPNRIGARWRRRRFVGPLRRRGTGKTARQRVARTYRSTACWAGRCITRRPDLPA